jgi:hypothetical protein
MPGAVDVYSRWIRLGYILPKNGVYLTFDRDRILLGEFDSFAKASASFDGLRP